MTINEYQKEALRTANRMDNETDNYIRHNVRPMLINGVMGLNGEAGECIDLIKKTLFQGHELDEEHLAEELGDVAWYLAVSAAAIGCNLEYILKKNVEKLQKRYPNGFESERSINRE